VTAVSAFQASVFANHTFKPVWAYKLPRHESIFAHKSARHLEAGAVVLAPEEPAWVMSLMNPSLRFVSLRVSETIHVFRIANRAEEGARRVEAQGLVTDGLTTPARLEALRQVLRRGLDAIVTTPMAWPTLARILGNEAHPWRVVEQTEQYLMMAPLHRPSETW
jgi:hypothetical protein